MRVLIFKILGAMAIIALILSCGYLYHIHNTKLNEIVDQLNRWNISVGQDFPRECPTGSKQTAGMGSLMAAFNAPEDTILSKECVFEEPVKDTQSITTSMRSLTFKRGGAKLLGSISLELKPDIKSGDKLIACSEEGLSLFSGNKDGFIQEALPDNPVILKMLPPNTKQIIYRQVVEMDGGLFVQLSCNIAVRTIYVHFFTDYSYTEKGVLYDKNRRFNFSNFGTPPLFSAVTNFGYQSYLAEINEQISKHEEHRSELSPLGKKLLDDTIALARDKQRFINHFVVTNKLTRAIALSSASGTTTDIIKQRAFYSRSPCLKNCIADKNNIGAPSCKAQSDLERTKADSTTYASITEMANKCEAEKIELLSPSCKNLFNTSDDMARRGINMLLDQDKSGALGSLSEIDKLLVGSQDMLSRDSPQVHICDKEKADWEMRSSMACMPSCPNALRENAQAEVTALASKVFAYEEMTSQQKKIHTSVLPKNVADAFAYKIGFIEPMKDETSADGKPPTYNTDALLDAGEYVLPARAGARATPFSAMRQYCPDCIVTPTTFKFIAFADFKGDKNYDIWIFEKNHEPIHLRDGFAATPPNK